eukprot:CAMPEP_0173428690 /NCGR_PEP_ID=MMETSP1357-20121228/7593_1 /TAXON_ID=77926 /ORGANISM="Hemiselmis rufescens, Strain PCC563" /LENGTH=62 /DNA_ID=CAMNT_0014392747 /DNA_START=8 /DNA_END=197 /DNA_ORIENTATION=-
MTYPPPHRPRSPSSRTSSAARPCLLMSTPLPVAGWQGASLVLLPSRAHAGDQGSAWPAWHVL